jgi:hypothetical protein
MSSAIRWPAEFSPAVAPIHVANRLEIDAAAADIWTELIRAVDWPNWYANSSNVRIEGGAGVLSGGARFTWWTFGVYLHSTVEEFVPMERVGWTGRGLGLSVYHAWLIEPSGSGCLVSTEESQFGLVARAGMLLFPQRMGRWHQRWLEGIASRTQHAGSRE